jgi:Flp pilus assembly protein TadG
MHWRLDTEVLGARSEVRQGIGSARHLDPHRVRRFIRRCQRRDEDGTALVELAVALPLVVLLLGVAFNGWNGMQEAVRLTSAARAGAIVAASDLTTSTNHPATSANQALTDATTAINQEEGVTNLFQSADAAANNYVSMSQATDNVSTGVVVSVVTITISHANVSLVPLVGSFPVNTHATARYS